MSTVLFAAFESNNAASGPTVDTGVISSLLNVKGGGGQCRARLKCDNDGSWYESDSDGNYGAAEGAWLTSGTADQVWIEFTQITGTLDESPGAGRHQCNTDRVFGEASNSGADTSTVSFEFFDAASGGNSLGTTGTITISAEKI